MGIQRASWCALLVLTLGACGGSPPAPPEAPPPPAAAPTAETTASAAPAEAPKPAETAAAPEAPAAPAGPAHDVWSKDMTKDQEVAFMKKNVVPEMELVFKEHDGARYAKFGCKTCHGPAFKNPHDFLPKLTFGDNKLISPDKPEVAKWMHEKVTPAMAAAMGMKPFDMETRQGFGCMGCHSVKMKEASAAK